MKKYTILIRKLKGKDQLEDPGVDGPTILNWILKKRGVKVWARLK
jgi:hypothetical protein